MYNLRKKRVTRLSLWEIATLLLSADQAWVEIEFPKFEIFEDMTRSFYFLIAHRLWSVNMEISTWKPQKRYHIIVAEEW